MIYYAVSVIHIDIDKYVFSNFYAKNRLFRHLKKPNLKCHTKTTKRSHAVEMCKHKNMKVLPLQTDDI